MADAKKILVVDDDKDIRKLLNDYLAGEGFEITCVDSAAAMWTHLDTASPDLITMDINLPDDDGFNLTRLIRQRMDTPIIILTGKDSDIDQVVGLEVGADDYLAKPFKPRILLARIKSILRRLADAPVLSIPRENAIEGWRFDPELQRLTTRDGKEHPLSMSESSLLAYFIEHSGKVVTRDTLCRAVHGREWQYLDRSIDLLIARLRRKLEVDPANPRVLKTIRGRGYVFDAHSDETSS